MRNGYLNKEKLFSFQAEQNISLTTITPCSYCNTRDRDKNDFSSTCEDTDECDKSTREKIKNDITPIKVVDVQ